MSRSLRMALIRFARTCLCSLHRSRMSSLVRARCVSQDTGTRWLCAQSQPPYGLGDIAFDSTSKAVSPIPVFVRWVFQGRVPTLPEKRMFMRNVSMASSW